MGIAQRTVEAIYPDFKPRFSPRKPVPSEVKTSGDYLLLKRIQADLSQPELAIKTGYAVRKIKMWEHDRLIPTAFEWEVLKPILSLDEGMQTNSL